MNPKGTGYFGSKNVSRYGDPCLTWTRVPNNDNVAFLPDLNTGDAQNFCRNIVNITSWEVPSCLIQDDNGNVQVAPCDIDYCGMTRIVPY